MADDKKPVEVAGAEHTNTNTSVNADAEKDVQNLLAELKGGETAKPADSDEKKYSEPAEKVSEPVENKTSEPVEKKDSEANGSGDAAKDEAAEEAKIVAAAAKLGEESEKKANASKGPTRGQDRGPRGRGGKRVNYRDNIKSDLTSQQESSDPDAIRKQLEFYFSDSNLPMDKFLLSKVGGSENRSVELSILHSFKRMRRFQPFSAIVEALKTSEKLELTNDNTCVRRKVPLPEQVNDSFDPSTAKVFEDKALHKSIYAKGFGKEEPSTQFDIEAFFAPYGPTSAIRLRRTHDKIFKGSVFVEFDSEDTQKAFLALDPKPKWKGDTELLIKSKKEYCDEKVKEIQAGRLAPSNKFNNNRGRGGNRGRGRDGNNDTRDWRDRRSEDQKQGYRSQRGNGRGGRGGNEGRPRRERDARGVPIVHATTEDPEDPEERAQRLFERRMSQQSNKSNSKSPDQKKSSNSPQPATTSTPAKTKTTPPPSEATAGQKRAREEEAVPAAAAAGAENGDDRPAKKVDVKDG